MLLLKTQAVPSRRYPLRKNRPKLPSRRHSRCYRLMDAISVHTALGRKSMLVLTLFIMGLSTFTIGLLPTYERIGVLAPMLLFLLRIIQGIGLGGDWGGASLMVLEHAPADRRGFYTSFVQIGFPIGLVLATLVFALVAKLPDADFAAYGWRIPFLASIVLLAVGTFVRWRLPETPVFEALKSRAAVAKNPLGEAFAGSAREFF